jgi:hypothetical protein
LWSDSPDRRTSRLFAAAVPVGYWAPFSVAPLVRGTGVDDPLHPIPGVAVLPTSLLGAAATTLTAVAGWIDGAVDTAFLVDLTDGVNTIRSTRGLRPKLA